MDVLASGLFLSKVTSGLTDEIRSFEDPPAFVGFGGIFPFLESVFCD